MRWHFLLSPPAAGDYNMALDDALMRRAARSGDAVFRVYGWSAPTLSLGRNQRARGVYDLALARAERIGIVRRPTGGRALLHHREVTYSATLPVRDAAAAREAYEFINSVLLIALRGVGVAATLATDTVSLPPGARPCFDMPAEREIVVGSRKLVGSAQWRRDGALLQHGSILIHDDQQLIARLMNTPGDMMPGAATLADALGSEPDPLHIAAAIRCAVGDATGAPPPDLCDDAVLRDDVNRLVDVYRDDQWTWRR